MPKTPRRLVPRSRCGYAASACALRVRAAPTRVLRVQDLQPDLLTLLLRRAVPGDRLAKGQPGPPAGARLLMSPLVYSVLVQAATHFESATWPREPGSSCCPGPAPRGVAPPDGAIEDARMSRVSNFERGLLSVVIPCYNEISVLPLFEQRLRSTLAGLSMPWEVVFVDDGSRDGSYERLAALTRRRPPVQGRSLLPQLRAPGGDRRGAVWARGRGRRDPRRRPPGPARADRDLPGALARGRPGRLLPAGGAQGGLAPAAALRAPSTGCSAPPPRSPCRSTPATSVSWTAGSST